jgi:hypothetical protein
MIIFEEDGRTPCPIEPADRDWVLFFVFALGELCDDDTDLGEVAERFDSHIDWVCARFASPDAWLGAAGDRYRQDCGAWNNPSPVFVRRWQRFAAKHADTSLAAIGDMVRECLRPWLHDA